MVVTAGALAGIAVGARLSRRLRRAASAAARVAAGDHTVKVSEAIGGRPYDEAADLAHAVDAMAGALQARLEAERRVTADIAHELRTPLTGLTTAAELLPPGRMTDLVRGRVQTLRGLIEDVLEVARLDTATERPDLTDIALGPFITRRVTTYAPGAQVRPRQMAGRSPGERRHPGRTPHGGGAFGLCARRVALTGAGVRGTVRRAACASRHGGGASGGSGRGRRRRSGRRRPARGGGRLRGRRRGGRVGGGAGRGR